MSTVGRVCVLGGSRYNLGVLREARDWGLDLLVVDRSPHEEVVALGVQVVACDFSNHKQLLDVVDKYGVQLLAPTNDVGVLAAAAIGQVTDIPAPSQAVAERATHKWRQRGAWHDAGLPSPRFSVVESLGELARAVEQIGLPVILKPADGYYGGSRGVSVVQDFGVLAGAFRLAAEASPTGSVITESFFLCHAEFSAEVLVRDGHPEVVAIGRKTKTALPYRVDLQVSYPSELSDEEVQDATSLITAAVRTVGVSAGAAHVEFGLTDEGFVLFELGARPGGGPTSSPILTHHRGYPHFVSVCLSQAGVSDLPVPRNVWNPVVLRFFGPGEVTRDFGMNHEAYGTHEGVLDIVLDRTRIGQAAKVVSGPDRVGYVVTTGGNLPAAVTLADEIECELGLAP